MISVLIDYKLDKYAREIKFAFDYIFDTLGLSHRFITDFSHLRQHDIVLLYGLLEPTLDELQSLTSKFITLFIQSDPKLYEPSGYPPDKLRRVLREVKLFSNTPVISERKFEYPAENYSELNIHACKVNFDLPGNVFYHLAAQEEHSDPTRDASGNWPEAASAFYQWKDTPFLDNFLWLLDNLLKEQCKAQHQYLVQKHLWPKAQDMAVALTHSVDDLQKWDFNTLLFSLLDDLGLLLTLRWKTLFRNLWSKTKYIFTNYEMYWNFQEYLALEKEQHLRSTWFIAAEKSPGLDYSLDDTDLQDEIKTILRQGGEIGLLTCEDKLSKDAFLAQRQIMLRQVQKEQLGIRQNGFVLNDKLRDLHEKLMPLYSSCLSFREADGFRNGSVFPFIPWVSGMPANHPELPVCFRDNSLKSGKYSLVGLDDAKQLVKKVFLAVRRRKGLLSLDFTLSNYADIPYCNKLYAYLLALVRGENSWCVTLSELTDWWEKRNRVTVDASEYDFSINFPDKLESFAVQLHGQMDIIQIEGVQARVDGRNIYFSNLEPDSIAVVRLGKGDTAPGGPYGKP